jgi:hypothetical protein
MEEAHSTYIVEEVYVKFHPTLSRDSKGTYNGSC